MNSFIKRRIVLRAISCLLASLLLVALPGCGGKSGGGEVSPTDAVSSEEVREPLTPASAVEILADGQGVGEVFILQYNWNGEEYASEDSLNKIMMIHYSSADTPAQFIGEGGWLSFSIEPGESGLSQVILTQYGNTVRAGTGIPYDTQEQELTADGDGNYTYQVSFRNFRMYYYRLDCSWNDGSRASYAFALEKAR